MAQTIALQRGAVTLSAYTSTLLFTNTSSGTATRMVVGYLSWVSDFNTVYGLCTFGVLRNGSSSPNFSIFAGTAGGPARTETFVPHDTGTGWHGQGISSTENSIAIYNQGGATPIQSSSAYSGAAPILAWYNKNVMLGPSDSVYVSWYDNGGGNRAATIQYCFTLITE